MINSYSIKELPLLLESIEYLLQLINSLEDNKDNKLKLLLVAVNATTHIYNRIDNNKTLSITLTNSLFYYVLS